MNTKKDRTKSFKFPVFCDYEIKVVSTNDFEKTFKRFKLPFDEDDKTAGALTIHCQDEAISYIFIPYKVSLDLMVHEAYHAIRHMLLKHSVKIDDNEVVAYHLGYLVQKISDWRWSWK